MPVITDPIVVIVLTAVINGAVTWGVVSTKLAWLRRDVDKASAMALEALLLVKGKGARSFNPTEIPQ